MASPAETPLELRNVSCQREAATVRDVSLTFAPATFTLLAGGPDSGHELLLRVLGLFEMPDRGEVRLGGTPAHTLAEEDRVKLRDRRIGFVFRAPFLLPAFTPIENVAMPLFKLSDADATAAQERGEELLEFVGLPELVQAPCAELSPVNQHRVALARALVNDPAVLLLENLDDVLANDDLRAFTALARRAAATRGAAVIATVSPGFAADPADRLIEMDAGAVRHDSDLLPRPNV